MSARLATNVYVGALFRQVHARGGAATVIARGDATSGSLLVLCAEKGVITAIYERILNPAGQYVWANNGFQDIENKQEIDRFCARRRRLDPDMWIIELDTANAERFIADFAQQD